MSGSEFQLFPLLLPHTSQKLGSTLTAQNLKTNADAKYEVKGQRLFKDNPFFLA